ncbi:MAG TPA: PVC-type heme-binding CxxCH protein [Planctomycetota bacterium]|nr:PVC-type heme-binding CxxCH protein [Planctomycetota bacterium]
MRIGLGVLIAIVALSAGAAGEPQDMGIPPHEAVKRMTVPPGFKAHLFAGEPDIMQPNAFCIDDRGRLWVAENFTYTGPGGPWRPSGRDAILIFEDTKGSGTFDKRTVFLDNLSFISGLEVGFGGVWVGSPPNLLFIPIKDDKPAGEPQVVLDGWGRQDQHETLNSFIWGPDGWLYGCHGVFTYSLVGKPGAPDKERTPVNAAIWRYHPLRKVFERFAEGTSNPWGVDFDDHGRMFIEACVIPHLWYIIQGGRYQRQGGPPSNKYTYDDIKTIADHRHENLKGRKGGHAHGGARFVLNDVWPAEWRGRFLIGTIHHHGMYTEAFEPKGSGYVGKHVDDFMMANDPMYLGFNHEFGPDGGLYIIDWYDPKPCHGQTPEHINTGRIYKITYGDSKKVEVDLSRVPSGDLVRMQTSENDWYVRHARRLLQERGPNPDVHRELGVILRDDPKVEHKLRALWALAATEGTTERMLAELLGSVHESVRCWAIQLLCEKEPPGESVLKEFAKMAREDTSPAVRLALAAAMQRIPVLARPEVLEALVAHGEDTEDHNLPLMIWYATEPLVAANVTRALQIAQKSKLPKVREYIIRRSVAGSGASGISGPKAAAAASVDEAGLVFALKPMAATVESYAVTAWGEALQPVASARPRRSEQPDGRPAIKFDGKSQHLVMPSKPETTFSAGDSFTISAWVYLADVPQGGWRGVVTKSRSAGPWYGLWIEPEGRWAFGGGSNVTGCGAIEGWQHVCAVQAGGQGRKLYVNGHLVGSGAAADGNGGGDLWIGGAATTKEFLAGLLGEIRLYRRALDASEVSFLSGSP